MEQGEQVKVSRLRVRRAALEQLMTLRWMAITGQAAAIATSWSLGISVPLVPLLAIVAALVAFNSFARQRLRASRDPARSEIAVHLALDLTAFCALLYLSGGAFNPFSMFFVLHAVLIALLLPPSLAALGVHLIEKRLWLGVAIAAFMLALMRYPRMPRLAFFRPARAGPQVENEIVAFEPNRGSAV